MIPYGKQSISQEDVDAVVEVLRSDFLTQGPKVPEFEAAISQYCSSRFAIATNSATSALHLACLAMGVGSGDVVWTSPITFVATANCAIYCGASVDFVDIDPQTYNMSPAALEEKLSQAELVGQLPKVVIPVHFSGQSCDMSEISRLSKKYGFKIIEDASHAIGGRYKGRLIGGCQYSDAVIFSFHPVKVLTTGEGGMLLTNDALIANKVKLLREHGITRDAEQMTKEPDGLWYYQQIELGYNYRLTDIQAALGISQLLRVDEFVKRRHDIARLYNESLSALPLQLPSQSLDSYSSFHLYVVRLKLDNLSKKDFFSHLRKRGVGVNLHYIPVYLQPYYQKLGFKSGLCPEAEAYYKEAISLPIYFDLVESTQLEVIDVLRELAGANI